MSCESAEPSYSRLLPDDELDGETRRDLAEYVTSRTGLDNRRWWTVDELGIDDARH